ncbi:hypothetical protein ACHAXT_009096 [Thalassiosira profunda]
MSSRNVIVNTGTPPAEPFDQWECATTEVRLHGFATLQPSGRLRPTGSNFACFDREWTFVVTEAPAAEPGMMSFCITNTAALRDDDDAEDQLQGFEFGFTVLNSNGKELTQLPMKDVLRENNLRGYRSFAKKSVLLRSVVNGTLIVEVRVRKKIDSNEASPREPVFIPNNPFACAAIRQMYNDEKTSDVTIEVGGQEAKDNATKKAKTSPVTFYAHQLILQQCTTTLAELCSMGGKGAAQITDVTPEIFGHLLSYVYGKQVPEEDMKAHARDIIDAADKYGVSHLKLTAEASFVDSTTIDVGNVMDLLLYADAKNLALLKEAVMDFIAENKVEVLEKVSFKDLPGGPTMFSDLLTAVARGEKKGSGANEEEDGGDQFGTMRISDLRRKAHEKGLGIDGSRETLIAALK